MRINLKKDNWYYIGLGIIFILAIFLRFYNLGQEDLWRDEAFSVILAQKPFPEFLKIALSDTSSFIYNFLLHFWIKVFGVSEISVRLPSFLFSIGTLISFILFVKDYFKRRIDQMLIATIFCVNIVVIVYAQEARVYSLLMFLVLGSFYFFSKLLQNHNFINAALYIVLTSLAFYAHSYSAFVVLAELIILIFKLLKELKSRKLREIMSNKNIKRWFVIYITIFAITFPWLLIMLSLLQDVVSDFWIKFHPLNTFNETITGFAVGIRLFSKENFDIVDGALNIGTILLSFLGTFSEIKKRKKIKIHFSILFWLPFVILYILSFITPILYIRYISFLAPFFIFLVYKGIKILFKNDTIKIFVVILMVLINLKIYFCIYQKNNTSKPSYRELTTYIKTNHATYDGIIHMDAKSFFPFEFYAKDIAESTIFDPEYETPFYVGKVMLTEDNYTRSLSDLSKYDRLWLVEIYGMNDRDKFYQDYVLIDEKAFKGELYLQLWEKKE
ncbi:glycosyltransferase family 39 protein [Candidatus Dojkabacteria bacterium]|nr:glycosyltransferase family 39 protein [Candidatus Dojkabacteria bacterium]